MWILGYWKHALTSARPRRTVAVDARVVDVHVDLVFDMTKCHWCFLGDWCDLIHHYICRPSDCLSIPYNVIVLVVLYDNTLRSIHR